MVNFEAIKTTLVEKGLAIEEMAAAATQTVVTVKGEWKRDGSAEIKEVRAGWVVGDFIKCVDIELELPAVSGFNKSAIESDLASKFPESKIIVKIQ